MPSDLDGAETCFPGFILIHVTMNAALTQSLEQMYAFKGWTAAGMTKYGPTAKHSAEKPRMTPETQMDALLSQARPFRSITPVPVRPRSRCELHSLRTSSSPAHHLRPPLAFNPDRDLDAFQLRSRRRFERRPDVVARVDNDPQCAVRVVSDGEAADIRAAAAKAKAKADAEEAAKKTNAGANATSDEDAKKKTRRDAGDDAKETTAAEIAEKKAAAAAAMAADAPESGAERGTAGGDGCERSSRRARRRSRFRRVRSRGSKGTSPGTTRTAASRRGC